MDQAERPGQLKRRGLVTGLAALVAGTLAKLGSPGRVEAGHDNTNVFHLGGVTNTFGVATLNVAADGAALQVTNTRANSLSADAILGLSEIARGVFGDTATGMAGVYGQARGGLGSGVAAQTGLPGPRYGSPQAGVLGTAQSHPGVWGESTNASGVFGLAVGPGPGYTAGRAAVHGSSSSAPGVYGDSTDKSGVVGHSGTAGPGTTGRAGVYGTSSDGFGVAGDSSTTIGVRGHSTSSYGVFGGSTNSTGVAGNSPNYIGVYGQTNGGVGMWGSASTGYALYGVSTSGIGIYGSSGNYIGVSASSGTSTALFAASNSGLAGYFQGPVQVQGAFTVLGGPKSAAVPHPDGSHRRLYCMESPDSIFEDFGEGQLVNGRADVRLDRDFAAVIHSDHYRVFLTPEGDSKGLYVTNKTPTGFEVREQQGGTSSVAFSYRVVAKRKDIAGPRLEKVDIPASPLRPEAPQPPPAIPDLPAVAPLRSPPPDKRPR